MNCIRTRLDGVLIIEPDVFEDSRGFFMESFSLPKYRGYGIDMEFVQDNHSLSIARGTIRGMHYQLAPKAQSKLVRVVRGEIFDVAVDIRKGSPTYGQWVGTELSAQNKRQVFVPREFANGFCSLSSNAEVLYKVDKAYSPELERCFRWDDPDIGIDWPVEQPVLSQRDRSAPPFREAENNFRFEGV